MRKDKRTVEKIIELGITDEKPERQKKERNGKMQKNVVVMAMSTLNDKSGELSQSKFSYEGSGKEAEEYYSQLEPCSRMILEKEGSLDHIIILATEATKVPRKFICQGEERCISAVDFYLERLEIKDMTKVRIIDLEEDAFTPAINETIDKIRKIWKMEHKKNNQCKLWIDTQGGFRNISLVMNAMMSLLKDGGIEVSGIYATKFNSDNKVQMVTDQTSTYKIFEFVSGINEFTRYGRGEQLVDYYDSVGATPPNTINTMKKIAESIQMCNMYEFDSELKELRKEVANNDVSQPSLINIFWNQIRNDYGPLLTEECTGLDVVEWFYKKKFYQQAITYIEAKLPQEWVDMKLITYEVEDSVCKELQLKLKKTNENKKNTMVTQLAIQFFKWQSIMLMKKKGSEVKVYSVDSFRNTKNLKQGRELQYRDANKIDIIQVERKYTKNKKCCIENLGDMKVKLKKGCEEEIMDMLLLYKLLKNERNNFNHMSERKNRADQETLGRVIKVGKEVYQA